MKTRIHVNQHVIRRNKTHDEDEPPLRVIQKRKSHPAYRVKVKGTTEVIYSPDKPLSCGARCWIETTGEVEWK